MSLKDYGKILLCAPPILAACFGLGMLVGVGALPISIWWQLLVLSIGVGALGYVVIHWIFWFTEHFFDNV